MLSCTFNPRDFTEDVDQERREEASSSERLISAINIATAYREDVDQ
jgi:hypothetical protein